MTPAADLPAALRVHAQGLSGCEAAVDLLTRHASWLRRTDFLHRFVHTVPNPTADTPMAGIDWPGAVAALNQGQLPCSGSERRILRIAASLADGVPVDLQDALTGLDGHHAALVSQAVTHATGHH